MDDDIDVAAARYPNGMEARMWAEVLTDAGIPTVLVELAPGVRIGSWAITPHELRVPRSMLDRAREILGAGEEG